MKIKDEKAEKSFKLNAINAQIRLFERFPSLDRETARKLEELKDERAALQVQIESIVTWPPDENEVPV